MSTAATEPSAAMEAATTITVVDNHRGAISAAVPSAAKPKSKSYRRANVAVRRYIVGIVIRAGAGTIGTAVRVSVWYRSRINRHAHPDSEPHRRIRRFRRRESQHGA